MSKQEFLAQLKAGLSCLPQEEIEERLIFYSEMIDDRMEEGLSEEDSVSQIGSVEAIVSQIVADIPLAKLVKEKIKPKRTLGVWEIVLLVLGSPVWLSILIAIFAVVLSVYIVLWSVIISLWAIEASVIGSAFGCVASGVILAFFGNTLSGVAIIGTGIFCTGLSIFLFFGCRMATKGILFLTKKIVLGIKSMFIGKEAAK